MKIILTPTNLRKVNHCSDVECESARCIAARRTKARTHICEDVECEKVQCRAYREELKKLQGDPWLR